MNRGMKHLRIVAMLLITGMLSATAFANGGTPVSPQKSFDGFYEGISGGIVSTHADFDTNASAKVQRVVFDIIETHHNIMQVDGHQDQAIGRIHIGYGRTLNSSFYAGVELGVSSANRRVSGRASAPYNGIDPEEGPSITVRTFDTHITAEAANGEFTLDFKPGVLLNDHALLYGRVGAAFNRITMDSTTAFFLKESSSEEEDPRTETAVQASTHDTCSETALRLGVGLAYLVSQHVVLNLDYTYTDYGRLRGSAKKETVTKTIQYMEPPPPTVFPDGYMAHTSARLKQQTVMLGVDYLIG